MEQAAPAESAAAPATHSAHAPNLDLHSLTRAAGPNLRKLLDSARQLEESVKNSPSLPENISGGKVSQAHILDRAEVLAQVQKSSTALLCACNFLNTLNDTARRGHADSEVGEEIITAVLLHVGRRLKAQEHVPEGEARLRSIYLRYHQNKLSPPRWMYTTLNMCDFVSRCLELPGPEAYLAKSQKGAQPSATLRAEVDELTEKIQQLRNSSHKDEGPSGDTTVAAESERGKVRKELDRMLAEFNDVDPLDLDSVCRSLCLQVNPRAELVTALIDTCASIGQAIACIASPRAKHGDSFVIELAEPLGDISSEAPVMQYKRVGKFALDASCLTVEESRGEVLELLLGQYKALREMLWRVRELWSSLEIQKDEKRRAAMIRLQNELGSVFVPDQEWAREVFGVLGAASDPRITRALQPFLNAKVLEVGSGSHRNEEYYLSKKENTQLLPLIFACLLGSDAEAAKGLAEALKGGVLRPASDLALRLRTPFLSKDMGYIASLLDHELRRVTSETSSFEQGASLLVALMHVSEDPDIRRGLKGRLKNLDLLPKLISSLNERLRQNKSPHAMYIESLRAQVLRRFSFDLDDYWGSRQLVAGIRKMFDRHLALLKRPDAWAGVAPSLVFPNGYLLHGEPGTGKTYFVTCVANQYGLPLVPITREEMAMAFKQTLEAGKHKPEDDDETKFAAFMQRKIAQAEEERKKSGALASIIFIDEMEVEFLKRDPAVSPRDELTRTNVMLRVIESLVKKHQEIIFIGATNHIEMVDPAALRRGRFGIHLELKAPDQEDVLDILRGTFTDIGVSVPEEMAAKDSYSKLVQYCVGVIPQAIRESVNNEIAYQRVVRSGHLTSLDDDLLSALIESMKLTRSLNVSGKASAGSVSQGE